MNNTQPLVSIIIPYYNGQKFILETIQSIKNQSYPNIELIVVDDKCSFEEDSEYINELKNEYDFKLIVNQFNEGAARSILKGCIESSGSLVSFLGQDDLIDSFKIEKQVNFMLSNPNYIACYTGINKHFKKENKIEIVNFEDTIERINAELIFPKLYYFNDLSLTLQGLLVEKDVLEKSIYKIWSKLLLDDWPVHIKLFQDYPKRIGFVPECLFNYIIHEDNVSHNKFKVFSMACDVISNLCPEKYKSKAIEYQISFLNEGFKKIKNKKWLWKKR